MNILEANKAIVTSFFQSINDKGYAQTLSGLPAECSWWSAGDTRTQAQTLDMIPVMETLFAGPVEIHVLNVTAEDNRVAVEASSRIKLASGKTYENTYVFLFFLQDGKIVHIREHADTRKADQALRDD